MPDDATRLPLIKNLWEEHGEGDLTRSHRVLYAAFFNAVFPDDRVERPGLLASTHEYTLGMQAVCNGHFLEGLGAIGPGTEFFTSSEYAILHKGLKSTGRFTDAELDFFSCHIEVDDQHYAELASALNSWAGDPVSCEAIYRGAFAALELEIEFWDGLYASHD